MCELTNFCLESSKINTNDQFIISHDSNVMGMLSVQWVFDESNGYKTYPYTYSRMHLSFEAWRLSGRVKKLQTRYAISVLPLYFGVTSPFSLNLPDFSFFHLRYILQDDFSARGLLICQISGVVMLPHAQVYRIYLKILC